MADAKLTADTASTSGLEDKAAAHCESGTGRTVGRIAITVS